VLRKITNTKQRSKRTPIEISGFFFVEILIVRWFRWDFVWKKGVLRIMIIQIKMRKDGTIVDNFLLVRWLYLMNLFVYLNR
jgi:hypothetical protein